MFFHDCLCKVVRLRFGNFINMSFEDSQAKDSHVKDSHVKDSPCQEFPCQGFPCQGFPRLETSPSLFLALPGIFEARERLVIIGTFPVSRRLFNIK